MGQVAERKGDGVSGVAQAQRQWQHAPDMSIVVSQFPYAQNATHCSFPAILTSESKQTIVKTNCWEPFWMLEE